MQSLILSMMILIWTAMSGVLAHDDYLPLVQPEIILSPCVERWNNMAAYFHTNTTMHTRPLVFENEPSELEVNLTVTKNRFESRYVGFNTRTYNGKIPPPTIKVCPGDRLIIRLFNDLSDGDANITNIHLHGMHISPKGHEDNVLTNIFPGGERVYDYHIRPDHPSGTFWYHPHSHGIVNTQLQGMMAGMLYVVDRPGDFPQELAQMDDLALILQAICVERCHNGHDIIANALRNEYDSNEFDPEGFPVDLRVDKNSPLNDTSLPTVYVNGQYLPEIHMKPGEFKRFRVLNAIANSVAELIMPDCEFHVLAMDGIYRNTPKLKDVVVIPPGSRADLGVMCATPGIFFLETEASPKRNHLLGKVNQHRVPSQKVVSLRVLDEELLDMKVPAELPRLPEYMENSVVLEDEVPEDSKYKYEFSVWTEEDTGKMRFGVNKQTFAHHYINYSMRVGEAQEWELSVKNYGMECDETPMEIVDTTVDKKQDLNFTNEQSRLHDNDDDMDEMADMPEIAHSSDKSSCHTMNHPFHLHGSHFQITDLDTELDPNGILFDLGEWRDTIPLFKSNVQIRFTPRDHMVGRILTHCHIASHSDGGMAQLVEVLPAIEEET